MKIEDLELSVRVVNILKNNKIFTVEALASSRFASLGLLGQKGIEEVWNALIELNRGGILDRAKQFDLAMRESEAERKLAQIAKIVMPNR